MRSGAAASPARWTRGLRPLVGVGRFATSWDSLARGGAAVRPRLKVGSILKPRPAYARGAQERRRRDSQERAGGERLTRGRASGQVLRAARSVYTPEPPRDSRAQLARRCRHGLAAHRRRASRLAEDRDRDSCTASGGAALPDGAGGLHDGDVSWWGRVARAVRGQAERRDAGVRRIRCGAPPAQLVSGRVGRVTCPDPGTMGVRSRFAGTAAHTRGAASAVACAPVGVRPGAWCRSWAADRRSICAARGARRGSSAGARTPH